jgi:hypothetical protein
LLPRVHLGQRLYPGEGAGRVELSSDQVLGGRSDDVSQVEVGGNLMDPGLKSVWLSGERSRVGCLVTEGCRGGVGLGSRGQSGHVCGS